jgi:ankyrin repeat protein
VLHLYNRLKQNIPNCLAFIIYNTSESLKGTIGPVCGQEPVVKLLVRHRADVLIQNRNGCTVAHWAASGGNLELCRYLHGVLSVDFSVANHAGNTPLSHALAYRRKDIVKWLIEECKVQDLEDRARLLAIDLNDWDSSDNIVHQSNEKMAMSMDLFGNYEYSPNDDDELQKLQEEFDSILN